LDNLPGWSVFFSELVSTLDYHASFHYKILGLLNAELKTRPTFRQAIDHFKRNVEPEEAVVKKYFRPSDKESERKKGIKKNIKIISSEYADMEEQKFGKGQDDSKKDYELFVDSTYLDFMLSNVENDRYKQMKDFKANIDRFRDDLMLYKKDTSKF